jgi:hypothetical protein
MGTTKEELRVFLKRMGMDLGFKVQFLGKNYLEVQSTWSSPLGWTVVAVGYKQYFCYH